MVCGRRRKQAGTLQASRIDCLNGTILADEGEPMPARTVHCAKLGHDLPGLDETTLDGRSALKMALLLGGPALKQRVLENVSADAWKMWKAHMLMVVNEFRLDPTSDQASAVLREHLEAFLFGEGRQVPGYVPPEKK
jgi:Fe-S cluster biosynthesis and repair protein YggX